MEKKIKILSKILEIIKKKSYEEDDDFLVELSEIYSENLAKQEFIKRASKLRTTFFKKNHVRKKDFFELLTTKLSKESFKDEKLKYPIQIFIDDFDQFSKIKKIKSITNYLHILEDDVENLFREITKEPYKHKHSGVENSDCFSTRFKFKGKRIQVAIAFNGRGKITSKEKGLGIPDCGSNGDQVIKLFNEPAKIFILQSVSKIQNQVYDFMRTKAVEKSEGGKKEVYYCLIDSADTDRIFKAYKK